MTSRFAGHSQTGRSDTTVAKRACDPGVFWTLGPYRGKSFEPKGIRCDVLDLVGGVRDVMPRLARGDDRHPLLCTERVTDHEGDPGRDRLPFPSRVTYFERCGARCPEVMQNRRKDSLESRMRARIAVWLSHAVHIARSCAGRRADPIGRAGAVMRAADQQIGATRYRRT
jgi:hypothetical protein